MNFLHLTILLLFVTILAACSTTEKAADKEISDESKELPSEKNSTPMQMEIETENIRKQVEIENINNQKNNVSDL